MIILWGEHSFQYNFIIIQILDIIELIMNNANQNTSLLLKQKHKYHYGPLFQWEPNKFIVSFYL